MSLTGSQQLLFRSIQNLPPQGHSHDQTKLETAERLSRATQQALKIAPEIVSARTQDLYAKMNEKKKMKQKK
jgi:hypothetical protein